jgi:hypothetical protein
LRRRTSTFIFTAIESFTILNTHQFIYSSSLRCSTHFSQRDPRYASVTLRNDHLLTRYRHSSSSLSNHFSNSRLGLIQQNHQETQSLYLEVRSKLCHRIRAPMCIKWYGRTIPLLRTQSSSQMRGESLRFPCQVILDLVLLRPDTCLGTQLYAGNLRPNSS